MQEGVRASVPILSGVPTKPTHYNTLARKQGIIQEALKSATSSRLQFDRKLPWEDNKLFGRLRSTKGEILQGEIENLKNMLTPDLLEDKGEWSHSHSLALARLTAIQTSLVERELKMAMVKDEYKFQRDLAAWVLGYDNPINYYKCNWFTEAEKRVISKASNDLTQIDASVYSASDKELEKRRYIANLREKITKRLYMACIQLGDGQLVLGDSEYEFKFKTFLGRLSAIQPQSEEECYLYYKYIVLGHGEQNQNTEDIDTYNKYYKDEEVYLAGHDSFNSLFLRGIETLNELLALSQIPASEDTDDSNKTNMEAIHASDFNSEEASEISESVAEKRRESVAKSEEARKLAAEQADAREKAKEEEINERRKQLAERKIVSEEAKQKIQQEKEETRRKLREITEKRAAEKRREPERKQVGTPNKTPIRASAKKTIVTPKTPQKPIAAPHEFADITRPDQYSYFERTFLSPERQEANTPSFTETLTKKYGRSNLKSLPTYHGSYETFLKENKPGWTYNEDYEELASERDPTPADIKEYYDYEAAKQIKEFPPTPVVRSGAAIETLNGESGFMRYVYGGQNDSDVDISVFDKMSILPFGLPSILRDKENLVSLKKMSRHQVNSYLQSGLEKIHMRYTGHGIFEFKNAVRPEDLEVNADRRTNPRRHMATIDRGFYIEDAFFDAALTKAAATYRAHGLKHHADALEEYRNVARKVFNEKRGYARRTFETNLQMHGFYEDIDADKVSNLDLYVKRHNAVYNNLLKESGVDPQLNLIQYEDILFMKKKATDYVKRKKEYDVVLEEIEKTKVPVIKLTDVNNEYSKSDLAKMAEYREELIKLSGSSIGRARLINEWKETVEHYNLTATNKGEWYTWDLSEHPAGIHLELFRQALAEMSNKPKTLFAKLTSVHMSAKDKAKVQEERKKLAESLDQKTKDTLNQRSKLRSQIREDEPAIDQPAPVVEPPKEDPVIEKAPEPEPETEEQKKTRKVIEKSIAAIRNDRQLLPVSPGEIMDRVDKSKHMLEIYHNLGLTKITSGMSPVQALYHMEKQKEEIAASFEVAFETEDEEDEFYAAANILSSNEHNEQDREDAIQSLKLTVRRLQEHADDVYSEKKTPSKKETRYRLMALMVKTYLQILKDEKEV